MKRDIVLFYQEWLLWQIKILQRQSQKQKKSLKLGICGEHGGDPKSVEFCAEMGLDYVSCSPYRVPVARLAAAQAYLKKKNNLF